jgi:hypothetical protein
VEQTDAGPSALGIPCLQGPDDKICLRNPAGCGPDIGSYAASLPRCNTGKFGGHYVAQCGDYDAIVEWGVDTTDLWYFDPRDGRVVAHVATGMQQPECSTADPDFTPPPCELKWCVDDAGL